MSGTAVCTQQCTSRCDNNNYDARFQHFFQLQKRSYYSGSLYINRYNLYVIVTFFPLKSQKRKYGIPPLKGMDSLSLQLVPWAKTLRKKKKTAVPCFVPVLIVSIHSHLGQITIYNRSSRFSPAVTRCCAGSVYYRSYPGKRVLDHAEYTPSTRQ